MGSNAPKALLARIEASAARTFLPLGGRKVTALLKSVKKGRRPFLTD
jgi:hypothetical protein